MELYKAKDLMLNFNGFSGEIKVDENGLISLNDLNSYFPNKRIDKWIKSESTQELISAVESKYPQMGVFKTKRGKHGGGTFAHELIAMDFVAWLSVEFKLKVYQCYLSMTTWSFKRYLASEGYKCLTNAVKDYIIPNVSDNAKKFQYSNEANLINQIVFGSKEKNIRDFADSFQLDMISYLEYREGVMIEMGMSYDERKNKLIDLYNNKISNLKEMTNE